MKLLFCTTNTHKFMLARVAGKKHGIEVEQLQIEADEIQSEDPHAILNHKVREVYKKVGRPLFVSDDSWNIPALGGFPGPYMKSVNHWFNADDWLSLMKSHKDKRIFLERRIAFIDGGEITTFEDIRERRFLDYASKLDGVSILKVTATKDGSKPINEVLIDEPESLEADDSGWDAFFNFVKSRQ